MAGSRNELHPGGGDTCQGWWGMVEDVLRFDGCLHLNSCRGVHCLIVGMFYGSLLMVYADECCVFTKLYCKNQNPLNVKEPSSLLCP